MFLGIDASEVNTLALDLDRAAGAVGAGAAAVVKKGAVNVKREAREFAPKGPMLPAYYRSITFDIEGDGRFGQVAAVIGPDKDLPQGPLGNILEYGTSTDAPQAHLGPALDREGPRFADALGDLGERLLKS